MTASCVISASKHKLKCCLFLSYVHRKARGLNGAYRESEVDNSCASQSMRLLIQNISAAASDATTNPQAALTLEGLLQVIPNFGRTHSTSNQNKRGFLYTVHLLTTWPFLISFQQCYPLMQHIDFSIICCKWSVCHIISKRIAPTFCKFFMRR